MHSKATDYQGEGKRERGVSAPAGTILIFVVAIFFKQICATTTKNNNQKATKPTLTGAKQLSFGIV